MTRSKQFFPLTAIAAAVMTSGASAQVLEEVVVTAQKREQSIQDVGISVTAFTGDQINALGYTNAQEITALAPGVSTLQPNGPSNYAIAIRGVAQNDFISNQESPVSIYIDDVYLSQMSSAGFMLFDLERVEILRGPQGTLYGRNATGGLAHYVSRKPTQEFDGYAQLTGGYYDQVKFQGALGGGLTDTLAARLSVATHHNGGYVENRVLDDDINNANDYAGRLQFLFEPRDDMELLVNIRGALQQIRTGFFENVSARFDPVTGNGFNTPDLTNFNGYRDTDNDNFAGDYDLFGHQDLESYGFSGTFKWDLNDRVTMTSITDYQKVKRDYLEDSDASPSPDFNFFLVTDAEQFS
ncbi:MAG: TonB-dependent receptor, partial [Gammaproteobacteria bacterium]